MNFGRIYNFDLETKECGFEVRKEIYSHQHSDDLPSVFGNLQNYILQEGEFENANIKKKSNFLEIYNNKENVGDVFPKNVGYYSMLRNYNSQEFSNKLDYSEIKSAITTKFQHMKSVLGHISIVDGGDSIIPVPIYCICFSKDNEIIFTGDNNGYLFTLCILIFFIF